MNNLDWFGPMSFLAFLRDVGKYARVGAMLAKDSVRATRAPGRGGHMQSASGARGGAVQAAGFDRVACVLAAGAHV